MEAALDECVNDKVLRRRLQFYWSTAHAMLQRLPEDTISTSAAAQASGEQPPPKAEHAGAMALAHIHSSAFVRLVETMQTSKDKPFSRPLPRKLMEHFCDACFGLLVPGKSAHVRVVHQRHNAAVNKKLARAHAASKRKAKILHKTIAPCVRVRNAVVTTCHHCRHRRTSPGTPVAAKRSVSKPVAPTPPPPVVVKRTHGSLFGPPPSPPRKLLDGKKKKKKAPGAAPPSALDSFLKSLQ